MLTLISHHLCPYVQRAAIVLLEKGVAFERAYVDLSDKPDWFRALSPLGKVPLLRLADTDGGPQILFESGPICEWIEETQDGPALHPADPLTRARHRAWMEFGSSILGDLWGMETAQQAAPYDQKRRAIAAKFERLEQELGDGPYFAGDRFSMVDAVFAPIFRYFDVFDAIADTGVFTGRSRLSAWRRELAARQSVRSAVTDDYDARLRSFLAHHDAHLLKLAA